MDKVLPEKNLNELIDSLQELKKLTFTVPTENNMTTPTEPIPPTMEEPAIIPSHKSTGDLYAPEGFEPMTVVEPATMVPEPMNVITESVPTVHFDDLEPEMELNDAEEDELERRNNEWLPAY